MRQVCEWQIVDGPMIILLLLEELLWIKRESPGALLMDVHGNVVEARHAYEDTRDGYVAYGRRP